MRIFLLFTFNFFSFFVVAQSKYAFIDWENESAEEFQILDSAISNKKVILTGENHLYAEFNAKLQLRFLLYLNQNHGFKNYIWEQSPAVGYLINQMAIEGNEEADKFLKDQLGTDYYLVCQSLKYYNDTVDASQQIVTYGIDVERFPVFSIYALKLLVDKIDSNRNNVEVIEQILALASSDYVNNFIGDFYTEERDDYYAFGDISPANSLQTIILNSEKQRSDLAPLLGSDSSIYYAIIESMAKGRDWYLYENDGDVVSPITREKYMADEFHRIYQTDTTAKFYGQFGSCHVSTNSSDEYCFGHYFTAVAKRIQDGFSKDELFVLPIVIFYNQGLTRDNKRIQTIGLDKNLLKSGESFIADISKINNAATQNLSGFIIVCNEKTESFLNNYVTWSYYVEEFHLSAYYGYRYFNKINKLNNSLTSLGYTGFTNKFQVWNGEIMSNYFEGDDNIFWNVFYNHSLVMPVSNNDDLEIKGYLTGFGYSSGWGNKWFLFALSNAFKFGSIKMTETLSTFQPSPIISTDNKLIYKNGIILIEPSAILSLRFPALSFNIRGGYGFDVSSKYWKHDTKLKNFTKTSFSSPFIEAGVSLYIRYNY